MVLLMPLEPSSRRLRVLFPARALPRSSSAAPFAEKVGLVAAQREDGVEPEFVVIVDVLVAEGDRVDALSEQVPEFVFDEWFAAVVDEAGHGRAGEAALAVDLAQQNAAAVAGEVTP